MSYYVHDVPGRLRIKSPTLKYNQKQCQSTRELLSVITGVVDVKVNLSTGSATVYYDKDILASSTILNELVQKKIINRPKITKSDPFIANVASEAGEKAGKAILGYAVEQALRANGLSLLAALV